MPRAKPRKLEEYNLFARLLVQWMREQDPPVDVPELAERLGVPRQTVYKWLNDHALPRAESVQRIADVTDLPLEALYEAAGIEPGAEGDPYVRIIQTIRRASIPEAEREHLVACIRAMQGGPDSSSTNETPEHAGAH